MILLDTNAIVWAFNNNDRLGATARSTIMAAQDDGELGYSSMSLWEIAMLLRKGKLQLAWDAERFKEELKKVGVAEIPLSGDMAILAGTLDGLHGDPADRIIVATAIEARMRLMTSDRQILAWDGPLTTIDARL